MNSSGNSKTNKSTFCIMPWVHFHVAQNGNVIPCCQAPPHKVHRFGNINEQSIEQIWESDEIKVFREKMLANEQDVRCKQCYLKEKQGAKSLREVTNEKFKEEVSFVKENKSAQQNIPIHFDIRFSNACNLKCRICGPWASSQWYKDAVALGMRKKESKALTVAIKNEDDFFKEIIPLLPNAKEFYFAGGEPLMMEQHYNILDALFACGNTSIQLTYNTNFSTFNFKNYNVIDYWKQFKNIDVTASLDAEGKKGELLRKNLNWETVLNNRLITLRELPQLVFQLAPTVGVFNVAHLTEFHKNWVKQGLINVEDFIPNILIVPKEYQINVLPLDLQEKLKPVYEKHMAWMNQQLVKNQEKFNHSIEQFKSIYNQLGTAAEQKTIESFKNLTTKLDDLRKEDTLEVFSELNLI